MEIYSSNHKLEYYLRALSYSSLNKVENNENPEFGNVILHYAEDGKIKNQMYTI